MERDLCEIWISLLGLILWAFGELQVVASFTHLGIPSLSGVSNSNSIPAKLHSPKFHSFHLHFHFQSVVLEFFSVLHLSTDFFVFHVLFLVSIRCILFLWWFQSVDSFLDSILSSFSVYTFQLCSICVLVLFLLSFQFCQVFVILTWHSLFEWVWLLFWMALSSIEMTLSLLIYCVSCLVSIQLISCGI